MCSYKYIKAKAIVNYIRTKYDVKLSKGTIKYKRLHLKEE